MRIEHAPRLSQYSVCWASGNQLCTDLSSQQLPAVAAAAVAGRAKEHQLVPACGWAARAALRWTAAGAFACAASVRRSVAATAGIAEHCAYQPGPAAQRTAPRLLSLRHCCPSIRRPSDLNACPSVTPPPFPLPGCSSPPPSVSPSADLNAADLCGYFYWTGSWGVCQDVTRNDYNWYLTCNPGYYLRPGTSNNGACYGYKTCCYDPGQGYAGSCTHVCTYNYCPSCCYYCCKCTNSYVFGYPNGVVSHRHQVTQAGARS